MTLSEFKAWLDGYNHSIKHAPIPEQWSLIKNKLDLTTDSQVSFVNLAPSQWPEKPMVPICTQVEEINSIGANWPSCKA